MQVLSHSETLGISDPAIKQIPAAIVAANSADVDIVSGATNTSRGIIAAVKNAMGAEATAEEPAGKVLQNDVYERRDDMDAEKSSEIYYGGVAARQEKYAPVVRTLENGVKVQRTPYDQGIYNNYFLHSDERGCYACHDDLNEALQAMPRSLSKRQWMPSNHLHLNYVNDMKVTIDQCISCHISYGLEFNTCIHGVHQTAAFRNMGGSCESCHVVTNEGEWALWDDEKSGAALDGRHARGQL